MTAHRIGTTEEHLAARLGLLAAEKEHTRRGDELARRRRALPWTRVEKQYIFETDDGPRTLAALSDSRSQLLVYHFMYGPDWSEGCPICSFWADGFDGAAVHLRHRDVTLVCASQTCPRAGRPGRHANVQLHQAGVVGRTAGIERLRAR